MISRRHFSLQFEKRGGRLVRATYSHRLAPPSVVTTPDTFCLPVRLRMRIVQLFGTLGRAGIHFNRLRGCRLFTNGISRSSSNSLFLLKVRFYLLILNFTDEFSRCSRCVFVRDCTNDWPIVVSKIGNFFVEFEVVFFGNFGVYVSLNFI